MPETHGPAPISKSPTVNVDVAYHNVTLAHTWAAVEQNQSNIPAELQPPSRTSSSTFWKRSRRETAVYSSSFRVLSGDQERAIQSKAQICWLIRGGYPLNARPGSTVTYLPISADSANRRIKHERSYVYNVIRVFCSAENITLAGASAANAAQRCRPVRPDGPAPLNRNSYTLELYCPLKTQTSRRVSPNSKGTDQGA